MIDLGISKLALIGVVALVVIGPEKLPRVARMAGTLFGRAQRYINDVKAEVSKEIELESLRKMQTEVEQAAQNVSQSINQGWQDVSNDVGSAFSDAKSADVSAPLTEFVADPTSIIRKRNTFRRKKLARTSAVPQWYKSRHQTRQHVISGSARMAKFRANGRRPVSFF